MTVTLGSLFTGTAALDHAIAAALDCVPVWFCDNDRAASALLAHHYPDTPNLGDVTQVDWATVPPVDVLGGGFPCQDVSLAGRRVGMAPDNRSGLWSHMAFAISFLRPRLVIVENVRGILNARAHSDLEPCPGCLGDDSKKPSLRALGAVLGDLAALGYDAVWCGLRASDVGAPHPRFRVFVVAEDTNGTARDQWGEPAPGQAPGWGAWPNLGGRSGTSLAYAGCDPRPADDAYVHSAARDSRPSTDTQRDQSEQWGVYAPAIRRWERVIGRPAPYPTVAGRGTGRVLNPELVEWMMGLPAGHITGVPGLSRKAMLKLGGNGVVPHQAAAAVRHLVPMLSSAVAA